jgi:adenylate kinase family enzyme
MSEFPPLESLGNRIMVCGPSNSGKSTLTAAIGRKTGLPVVHLDQLYHLPNTNWVARGEDEFRRLHAEAIEGDTWVMDGNYQRLFPTRLPRATGIVLIESNRWGSLTRYFRRTLFQRDRAGMLAGAQDSIKWAMIRWIMINGPRNIPKYREALMASRLPYVEVSGMSGLSRLYAEWGLTRK